jgi:hypothetical protein
MEQHRTNPVCATCHARMDPLGFALENFDATGKWRTVDANIPIDASGTLPDGHQFSGPTGLRELLADKQQEFAAGVCHDPDGEIAYLRLGSWSGIL